MPDDRPPSDAPPPADGEQSAPAAAPDPAAPPLSARELKAQRVDLARGMLARGYSPTQVLTWLKNTGPGKPWKLSVTAARNYLDLALEELDSEVTQAKTRKQARVRAMLTIAFQRAMDIASKAKHEKRAAGLLQAAIQAADKIAKVDGSYAYDSSAQVPAGLKPATAEEAVRIVAHAQATVQLALERGALVTTAPAPPPVVDATAGDDAAGDPDSDVADDAN